MKTFKKGFMIITIGVIITVGIGGCASAPVELNQETLSNMENASWEVKVLAYPPYGNNNFTQLKKDEIAYFKNISITKELENWKYYALSAPELPNTYYYVRKYDNGGMLLLGLQWEVYKSTTIDEESWNYRNKLRSVSWEVKELPNRPSLNGFGEDLYLKDDEDWHFVYMLMDNGDAGKIPHSTWCLISSSQMPEITYYYYTGYRRYISIGHQQQAYKNQSIANNTANNTTVNRYVDNNNRNSSNAQIFLNNGSMFYATIIEETSTGIRYTYPDKYGNMVFVLHISSIQSIKYVN